MSDRPPIRNLINGLHDRNLFVFAKEIAAAHHVTVEEMLSGSRKKQHAKAKHALIRLLCIDRGLPPSFVGETLGVDHTTVIYAKNKPAA